MEELLPIAFEAYLPFLAKAAPLTAIGVYGLYKLLGKINDHVATIEKNHIKEMDIQRETLEVMKAIRDKLPSHGS